jgi:N-acetyl-beta-hexosaminidase
MAQLKMNVLHWHLSDYQGFRVESIKFPKLHKMGSNGNFYTQARFLASEERQEFLIILPAV